MSALRPDQLPLLSTPGAPALHPSGDRAVVSLTHPDLVADEYTGQLWVVPLGDAGAGGGRDAPGGPRRLTRGHRDTAPRSSPDGRLLAFLRAEPGGRPQLHVVAVAGGEPLRLTDAPLGAGEPRWSPDGTRIAFVARHPETGRYGTVPGVGPEAEAPRLVTDLRYLGDGVGYVQDRRSHVFVVDVPDPGAEPAASLPSTTRLTDADADHTSVAWSPDGARLAFVSARHAGREHDLRADAWTCAVDGSDLVRATDTTLAVEQVAWSLDGERLWLLASDPGPDGREFIGRLTGLWSVPADGSSPPVRLTDPGSVDLDTGPGCGPTPVPGGVLAQRATRGAVELLLLPEDGGEARVLLGGQRWVLGHDAVSTPDGLVVVASVSTPTSSGDVVAVLPGPERVLTDFSAPLREAGGARPLREVTVAADDGYPVHGWVVLPDGEGPHPVLLDIHGGPATQYGWHVYDEAQVLAAAGYAVLLANPRGSSGYGAEHARCITGAFGQRDAADLLDFLDGALADPALALDAGRVGVLGGSYGGYMTAWLTAHPRCLDRFAAAVVERGFLDPESFAGTSDIGWYFGDAYLGTDPERVRAQSPMAAVDRVRMPTLVIHSEQDLRCPFEQGQRYFAALQRRSVESQLLVFPGESHGLTREGRPRHRRQRFEHVLRWWHDHLPAGGTS